MEDSPMGGAISTVVLPEMPECLLMDSLVLTRKGTLPVADVLPGCELRAGRVGCGAEVLSTRKLPPCERHMVTLRFDGAHAMAGTTLTASHTIMVQKRQGRSFQPALAAHVQRGDFVRTIASK